ncbi:MAG TPA: DEAD/DEAH box helicase [Candidatus Paceibacterota bacterium]|nr:DEAD/DEAH box helicase [Candidatus Pacearchaeota archaeon]HRZ50402.1 DEAD/DEAH box helicase [Candidatus Paceibacterota bacterium]HSA36123.1 DEAD/DEAH box helicase [Candidatus Paceibacterota bacterium]
MNSYPRFARGAKQRPSGARSARSGGFFNPRNSYNNRNRRAGSGGGYREHIDISRFVKQAAGEIQSTPVSITNRFEDFDLSPILKSNIKKLGFSIPTPIQDQAMPLVLKGSDVIGLANTGTGKTAAYLLPIIEKILKDNRSEAVIIAPTRELALQIDNDFKNLSRLTGISSAVLVGGMPSRPQMQQLRYRPNVVIGTPGRLKDFQQRRLVNFSHFATVVLDEVDRMLDMGFINDIKEIIGQLPKNRQSLFFSATMPDRIRTLSEQFLKEPVIVSIGSNQTADHVEQNVIKTSSAYEKIDELKKLLSQPGADKVLIFSDTKRSVEKLSEELKREGFKTESIHGNKRQSQRQKALDEFRQNKINVLVATDVAARGLDIKNVTHVINFTVPHTYDDYIHRIGRTGRANCKGIAYTFA